MVQAVNPGKNSQDTLVLKKTHVFEDWRLGIQPEYFECPICMDMHEHILECPHCHARACQNCLKDFSSMGNKVSAAEMSRRVYICSQCHKKETMMSSNKLMIRMLKEVIRINCDDCQRHWTMDEFLAHKRRNLCRFDQHADNNISALT